MPIYEYVCDDCGVRFSVLRRMQEADMSIPCEQCNGANTTRALSLFAASIRSASGESRPVAGSNGCGSCASHQCGSCHHH